MAASRLQFNRHRQMAETLPVLTSDYTTACLSFSRHCCQVSIQRHHSRRFPLCGQISSQSTCNTEHIFFVIAAMLV